MSIFDRKLSDLTVGDVAKGYAVYYSRASKPDKGYLFCFDGAEKLIAKHGL